MIEPLLLTVPRVSTYLGNSELTTATGFYFARGRRLFLVTSRHVVFDEASGHQPDRLMIELHTDAGNLAKSTGFSIPLYRNGRSVWREGLDANGAIDVAAIAIDRSALPATAILHAFTPAHLPGPEEQAVEIGATLLVVGFPLGFHDTLHHMPVARQAALASSYGWRFQGQGYFLTDARTHRGTSGAPVVMRVQGRDEDLGTLPWLLLGIHSTRLDIGTRDIHLDEALGLNCTWYADILLKLTDR